MRTCVLRAAVLALLAATVNLFGGQVTAKPGRGPSTVDSPYLVPVATGVQFVSILAAGESVNLKPDGTPYRMVGIPDGLGAFSNGDGTFTLLMNHELGIGKGIARRHGGFQAFVSEWTINSTTLAVSNIRDLTNPNTPDIADPTKFVTNGMFVWDSAAQKYKQPVTLHGGIIGGIAVVSAGVGYTSAPTVTITGGGGTGATATAVLGTGSNADKITSVTVDTGGTGFTSQPTVTITGGGGTTQGTAIALFDPRLTLTRLCSADLAPITAFQFTKTNSDGTTTSLGTRARMLLNGEENVGGRAFAHVATGTNPGTSYELPKFGKLEFENLVACPLGQEKTIVCSQEDGTVNDSNVYVYVGTKTSSGSDPDKAGLNNGKQYVVVVAGGVLSEDQSATPFGIAKGASAAFSLAELPDQAAAGADTVANTVTAGGSNFRRCEDGAWDPSNTSDYYFVTTDQIDDTLANITPVVRTGRSRLWKMHFADIANPETGGTISLVLDGTEGQIMFDNMCIDKLGNIIIQEDPGNSQYLARIWLYNIGTKELKVVAKHDPARFGDIAADGSPIAPSSSFSVDEESSGVMDASDILGSGWFLLDVQAHRSNDIETVEKGQLLAMFIPDAVAAPVISGSTGKFTAPASVVAGTAATFTVAGTTATTGISGATLTWVWDFGDGTATATGTSVTHTFATAGIYNVTVTGTDSVTGKTVTNSQPITVKDSLKSGKMLITLNFLETGKDTIFLTGALTIPTSTTIAGQTVHVNIGGVEKDFTLEENGSGGEKPNMFKIFKKKKVGTISSVTAKFYCKLFAGNFHDALADEGLISKDADRESKSVRCQITFIGRVFEATLTQVYSAKLGKIGKTR